jgi:hypothetical protein
MSDAFSKFLKDNTGGLANKAFLGFSVVQIAQSNNKLKETLKLLRDMAVFKFTWAAALSTSLLSVGKIIHTILRDTGSLDAALRKLGQIQGFQRQFAPLLGGVTEAKRRVAELLNFTASTPFQFKDVAEASRSLEIMTRGAYSGGKALSDIGDAAAATGNGLSQTADAVGAVSAALRNGDSIGSAVEQLRAMGVVSGIDANFINQLADSGAAAGQVFSELTGIIQKHRGGMASYAKDVESVNAAHSKAAAALQEKIAAPFTAAELKSTENMTAAMIAIAPAVERVSEFFSKLFGGFSTASSAVAKFVAQNDLLRTGFELGAKGLGLLVPALVFFGAIAIPSAVMGIIGLVAWLETLALSFGVATTAITIFATVTKAALITTGIGALLVAVGTLAGVIMNFTGAAEKAKNAIKEMAEAHAQALTAMKAQISAIQTLTDKQEAYTKVLEKIRDLHEQIKEAGSGGGKNIFGANVQGKNASKLPELLREKKEYQQQLKEIDRLDDSTLKPGAKGQQYVGEEYERNRMLENEGYKAAMEKASPEGKLGLMQGQLATVQDREVSANAGARADLDVEKERAQLRVEQARTRGTPGELAAEVSGLNAGMDAPKDSSVYADTMRQKVLYSLQSKNENFSEDERGRFSALAGDVSGTPADVEKWRQYSEQRKKDQGNRTGFTEQGADLQSQITVAQREFDLSKARVDTEKQIADLKSRGAQRAEAEYQLRMQLLDTEKAMAQERGDSVQVTQIEGQQAEMTRQRVEGRRDKAVQDEGISRDLEQKKAWREGRGSEAVSLGDLSDFAGKYQQLLQTYSPEEAKKIATAQSNEDIAQSAADMARNPVVDSLQRIAGGGGVSADPMMSVAQRQLSLQEKMAGYLQILSERENETDDGTFTDPE